MTGEFLEDFEGSKLANLNTPFVRDLKRKKKHIFWERKWMGTGTPGCPRRRGLLLSNLLFSQNFERI